MYNFWGLYRYQTVVFLEFYHVVGAAMTCGIVKSGHAKKRDSFLNQKANWISSKVWCWGYHEIFENKNPQGFGLDERRFMIAYLRLFAFNF